MSKMIKQLKEAIEAMGGHRAVLLKRELGSAQGRKYADLCKYAWDYYTSEADGWGGWGHHTSPITMAEILWAVTRLRHQSVALPTTGVGTLMATDATSSMAREMVRDLILYRRGVEPSTLEWFTALTEAKALHGRPASN